MTRTIRRLSGLAAAALALLLLLLVSVIVSSPAGATQPKYVTAVWSEPSWAGPQTPTWSQTLVSQTPEDSETLAVSVPDTCGTQYQVDSYLRAKLPKAGLPSTLASGDDTSWLAPGGWDTAYKLVQNDACPITVPVPVDQTPTAPTCTTDGSYTLPVNYATADGNGMVKFLIGGQQGSGQPYGPGTYQVSAHTTVGYVFTTGDREVDWTVVVAPKLSGDQCDTSTPTPTETPTPTSTPTSPTSSSSSSTPVSSTSSTTHASTTTSKSVAKLAPPVSVHRTTSAAHPSPAAKVRSLASTGNTTAQELAIAVGFIALGIALVVGTTMWGHRKH